MDDSTNIGFPLDAFADVLERVDAEFDADPAASFDPWSVVRPCVRDYARTMGHGEDVSFMTVHADLPFEAFRDLSFQQTCMIHHSGTTYMAERMRRRREDDPRWAILHKLKSSAWQWSTGSGRIGWNDMVDAHAAIRSFDLAAPGFETTLDWTRGTIKRGASLCSATWIDGVFAYLVHHRGRHVMTIGFSVTADRRVLIQQIQNKEQRGNRWLFSFPKNRVEHVIERFADAFRGFVVMLADGADIAGFSLSEYRKGLKEATACRREHAAALRDGEGDPVHHREMRRAYSTKAKEATLKVAHLKDEVPRLAAFYAASGRYRRGETLCRNGISHYAMAA